MIIKEFYKEREDGVRLYRTYSDSGMKIRQIETGNMYAEAVDVEFASYTYLETEIPIMESETEEDAPQEEPRYESDDFEEGVAL